jgi:ketosteroid isomerase-like protein
MMKTALALCTALCALASLAAAPVAAQEARSQISPADTAELRAFKAATRALYDLKEKNFAEGRDDDIIGRFYSKDAVSAGQAEGVLVGSAEFKTSYDGVVKTANVKVVPVYTYVNGDAGWDWANFFVTPKDSREKPFSFAIVFLWAKENGQWVCKGDAYIDGAFPTSGAKP